MRDGILEQLRNVATDKTVLIVGPASFNGLGPVKQRIHDLNRKGEWIDAEFRDSPNTVKVNSRIGVILTMVGVSRATLTTLRSSAERHRVACPNQALTPGEVKAILDHLSERRSAPRNVPVQIAATNGNSAHADDKMEHPHVSSHLTPPATESDARREISVPAPAPSARFALPQNNSGVAENLRQKVLHIEELYRAAAEVTTENQALRDRVAELELELEGMKPQLATLEQKDVIAKEEVRLLSNESSQLKQKNEQLQSAFDKIVQIISAVQKT